MTLLLMMLTSINAWAAVIWTGDGSQESPYQIDTYEKLKEFAAMVNDVNNSRSYAWAILTADILCTDNTWTPIGQSTSYYRYTGTFDGRGYTITGLSNTGVDPAPSNAGLFGYVGSSGIVQNVILADATLIGSQFIGGIAGYNNGGTIQNSCLIGTSSISSTYSSSYGTGGNGGIVGFNRGTVAGCYVAISGSGSISDTGGDKSIGGIIGTNVGTLENCHYSGSGAISTSFTSVNLNLGGVVGNNTGSASYCYYAGTGAISGSDNIGPIIGSNSATVTSCYYNTSNTTLTDRKSVV